MGDVVTTSSVLPRSVCFPVVPASVLLVGVLWVAVVVTYCLWAVVRPMVLVSSFGVVTFVGAAIILVEGFCV